MANGLAAVLLQHRSALLRFLRARAGEEAAEDLLHELWLRMWVGESEPIADPLAYLYRAADNLVLDRHRSSTSRVRREEEWVSVVGGAPLNRASHVSGEDLLMARDQIRAAEAVLVGLGERTATIFRHFRLDGRTQAQIAEEMGISISAVEKHLQRAYRALIQLRRDADAA